MRRRLLRARLRANLPTVQALVIPLNGGFPGGSRVRTWRTRGDWAARTGQMTTTPREFFDRNVKPAYGAWRAEPLTEWKMRAAVAALNDMAEHVFHHWGKGHTEVYGAVGTNQYRISLGSRECGDFTLVRDIAEGHKHVTLTRKNPKPLVTKADQVTQERHGGDFSADDFSEDFNIGTVQFVITLDDGVTKRAVSDVGESTLKMWEGLLRKWGM